jgi:glycosyltransferase involved in cell wall biosynthesis
MEGKSLSELISIIIPVYNAQNYIRRCLDSVLNQTYRNIEIILVNDGSNDNSGNICNEYLAKDCRIRVIHKNNGGVAAARNSGLKIAKGEYIGFIDNDDYIEPTMYATLEKVLAEHEDALIAQILIDNVNEDGHNIRPIQYQNEYIKKIDAVSYRIDLLLQRANMTCWSKLFRKQVFQKHEFLDGRWNEDFLLLYKVMLDVPYILSINEVGYHYVYRKGSYSNAGFNQGITDNVVNSKWVMDYTLESEPNLTDYAIRLYFHQCIPYLLFLPSERIIDTNILYKEILNNLSCLKSAWLKNPYLSSKEKLILYFCLNSHKIFRKILVAINYKNYYKGIH